MLNNSGIILYKLKFEFFSKFHNLDKNNFIKLFSKIMVVCI